MSGGGYPPGFGGPGGNHPPGGFGPPGSPGGYGAPPPGQPPYGGYGATPGGYGYGGPGPGYPGGHPGAAPNAPYGIDPTTGLPFSDKQKLVAFLLQFFFGMVGAGRFYTGHTTIAVLQLLFGWLTCGLWPFIDSILMLIGKVPDAQGRPLRD